MKPLLRRAATRGGLLLLAGALVYLALRGADLDAVMQAIRRADWIWILPLVVVTMASHILRAWRWQVLLAAVESRPIPFRDTFCALMIGTMTNYALPRVGEFVRAADIASRQDVPFPGVLGTVVVERVLDVLVLAAGLGLSLLVVGRRARELALRFAAPLADLPTAGMLAAGAALLALAALAFRLRRSSFWTGFMDSFRRGLRSAHRSPRPWTLAGTTVAMWSLYVLMAWIPFAMLNMAGPHDLSLLDGMAVMFLGAVGVAVPLPGGLGSFHYITRVVLVTLFGIDTSLAVTYAVLVHGGQLLLYVAVGAAALAAQGLSFGQLWQRTRARHGS